MSDELTLVGEVKTKSPFGYVAKRDRHEQFKFAHRHADMLSIHTNPSWGGSFDWLQEACARSKIPVLAKGFHPTNLHVQKAIEAGADWVLCVGSMPTIHRDHVWYEPYCLEAVNEAADDLGGVVWNSRDPRNGTNKEHGVGDARDRWDGRLCQASNIATIEDVSRTADAALVGRHLRTFVQSLYGQ